MTQPHETTPTGSAPPYDPLQEAPLATLAPKSPPVKMMPQYIAPETPTVTPGGSSPTLDKLFAALAKAQGEYAEAAKDSYNPWHKYHYASAASIVRATRPALAKYGLCVTQLHQLAPKPTEPDMLNVVRVQTVLGHESGQWMTSIMDMPVEQRESESGKLQQLVHCVGAAATYAERYSYKAMCCVPVEDSDGTVGQDADQKTTRQTTRRTAPSGNPVNQALPGQPEPTFIPDDYQPPREEGPGPPPDARRAPMTNAGHMSASQWADAHPAVNQVPEPHPSTPIRPDEYPQPYCPLCHALATIYDGGKWGKEWVCGTTKGGCGAWFKYDDPYIKNQDGSIPSAHQQAEPAVAGRFMAAVTAGLGQVASPAFHAKWSKALKVASLHLLSQEQMVILHRIMEVEPAYIAAKKEAEHQRQGAETF